LKAPIFTWDNAWFNGPHQFWSQNASIPVNVDGTKVGDILLIDETLDAATPFEGSLEVRRRFPGARLIAEPNGTTHAGGLQGNTCVDNLIAQYLQSGELPPRKTSDGPDVQCAPLSEPMPTTMNTTETKMIRTLLNKHVHHYRRQKPQHS
jgi:hypothetical protein